MSYAVNFCFYVSILTLSFWPQANSSSADSLELRYSPSIWFAKAEEALPTGIRDMGVYEGDTHSEKILKSEITEILKTLHKFSYTGILPFVENVRHKEMLKENIEFREKDPKLTYIIQSKWKAILGYMGFASEDDHFFEKFRADETARINFTIRFVQSYKAIDEMLNNNRFMTDYQNQKLMEEQSIESLREAMLYFFATINEHETRHYVDYKKHPIFEFEGEFLRNKQEYLKKDGSLNLRVLEERGVVEDLIIKVRHYEPKGFSMNYILGDKYSVGFRALGNLLLQFEKEFSDKFSKSGPYYWVGSQANVESVAEKYLLYDAKMAGKWSGSFTGGLYIFMEGQVRPLIVILELDRLVSSVKSMGWTPQNIEKLQKLVNTWDEFMNHKMMQYIEKDYSYLSHSRINYTQLLAEIPINVLSRIKGNFSALKKSGLSCKSLFL